MGRVTQVANAAFDIDSSTGVVTLVANALTHGTTYSYSVVVADAALPTNNEASETITFTITESNAAPVLDSAMYPISPLSPSTSLTEQMLVKRSVRY